MSGNPFKRGTRHVLVVEDDLSVARAVALVLSGPDCKVCVVASVGEALDAMARQTREFDVVVTDNKMPFLSGVDLVRRLRGDRFGGRIIVLSAYVSAPEAAEYRELGVDVMMAKPFLVADLRRAVGLDPIC